MLAAGFAPLDWLKGRLLPAAAVSKIDWDSDITALGLAMAKRFGRVCNRDFDRSTSAEDIFNAKASAWVLRRYPVESITTLKAVQPDGSESSYGSGDYSIDLRSGVLETYTIAGSRHDQLEVSYTGGYWLNPQDASSAPAGATELPEDLLEAFVAQCQEEAQRRQLFGAVGLRREAREFNENGEGSRALLPWVREVLETYRRFAP